MLYARFTVNENTVLNKKSIIVRISNTLTRVHILMKRLHIFFSEKTKFIFCMKKRFEEKEANGKCRKCSKKETFNG